jgi:hypothetical protein
MTDTKSRTARRRKATGIGPVEPAVTIVITADHVYLPVDESGNVGTPWTASDVSTSRVSKRTCLTVPSTLARFLSDRDQAEIVSDPSSFAKAKEDKSSKAPNPTVGGQVLRSSDRSVGG